MMRLFLLHNLLISFIFAKGICYALSDIKSQGYQLYKVDMKPGSNPLPVAQKIDLNTNISFDGEAEAYNSKDGLIYAFDEEYKQAPQLYKIDPVTKNVEKVKTLNGMKWHPAGASFYNGYFYVIATDGTYTLYKIDTKNWSILYKKDLSIKCSALAVNSNGKAYVIFNDNKKDHKNAGNLYEIDLNTAKTTYLLTIDKTSDGKYIEAEGLSFANDGNLYVENSESDSYHDQKLYKIDLKTGSVIPSADIHDSKADIEGLSCNVISTVNQSVASTCEDVFPSAVSSTLEKISMSGNSIIYNNNQPIIAKDLAQSGNAGCEKRDGICDITHTLAPKYDFILDTGYNQNDSISVGGNDSLTINKSGQYKQITVNSNAKLYINGDITLQESSQFSINGNSHLYINGQVTIQTDKFSSNGNSQIHIQSGYLKIIANDINYGGTTDTKSDFSPNLILLSKGKISFGGNVEAKAIVYADGQTSFSSDSKIYGALTSQKISMSGNSDIYYDRNTVDNFCQPVSKLQNVTISNISKYEGDSGVTEYKVTVNINPPATTDLTMTYSTEDGTAKLSDDDYQKLVGSKNIPKGTSSVVLTIKVNGDKKVEDDEYFYLNIKLEN